MAVILGVAGCATPRYETVTRRVAPAGPEAEACLETCERGLSACKQSCAEKYQACLKQAEPDAEADYRRMLDHYAEDLDQYRRELSLYDFQIWTRYSWQRGTFWYDPFPYPASPPPLPPRLPSREQAASRFLDARCGGDCGCQMPYDTCFRSCGGRIETELRCIRDCPAGR